MLAYGSIERMSSSPLLWLTQGIIGPAIMSVFSASSLAPEKLFHLLEISAHLNSTTDTDYLLPFIIRTAAEVLSCDAASLLLYDDEAAQLRFVAATGTDSKALAQIPVPLYGSIAGTIFRENRPLRIVDAEDDERHYGGVDEEVNFRTRSLLGVPMRVEGKVLGVLEALNKREGSFSDEDQLMLCIIADHAAVAIRTARQVHALQEAHDRVARTEALKSRLLTLASHEMRTPLTAIKGFAEIIRDGAAPGEMANHADVILEEVGTMNAVLETLSEMNVLRTGDNTFTPRLVPINDVVTAACEAVVVTVAEKRHTLRVKLAERPILVHADPRKLTTALTHLLDNAARFTPADGQIVLRISDRDGGALVEVADTGRGLDAEHLDAIFRDFFQVEEALTRTHGGLGLGLTIARGITEVHGGWLWAESDGPGCGATFYLWLPAAPTSLLPKQVQPPRDLAESSREDSEREHLAERA